MILKIFKPATPFAALASLLLFGIFWLQSFSNGLALSFLNFGALYHFEQDLAKLPGGWLLAISAAIIIATATILNNTVNRDEFFEKNTFLPFSLYLILMSLLGSFNTLNPIVISNFFLVLYLRWAFKIRRQDDARQIVFNASFLLSCACLFFPIYAPVLASPFVLLIIFRPFVWREWALTVLGLFLPAAFYAALMYFLNFPFESNTYNESFWELQTLSFAPDYRHYIYIVLFGILTVLSFFVVNRKMPKSSLRLRMLMRFLAFNYFVALGLSAALFFVSDAFIMMAALPLTFFFSYYFYTARRFWANFYFVLLLASIFYSLYFS